MKIKYLLSLCAMAAFSSCSTAYRSGQTPDDVYYSPAPVQSDYVSSASDNDANSYYYRNDDEGQINGQSEDQNYLTPSNQDFGFGYSDLGYNPYYYNSFGNPFYSYDPYGLYNPYTYYSFGFSGLGLYSPFGFYNSYGLYNPYMYYSLYSGHYNAYAYSSQYFPATGNAVTSLYSGPRRYNLGAYTSTGLVNAGSPGANIRGSGSIPTNTSPAVPVPIRRTSGLGNVIRRVFTPNRNNAYVAPSNGNRSYNNSNNYRSNNNSENYRTFNNNQTPSRTYNSSPSVSTPSYSGNSGGSAPVRTFRR